MSKECVVHNAPQNPRVKLCSSLYALGSADHENFQSLIGIVLSSPKGAEVMEQVADLGYKFMYTPLMGINGACNHLTKTIVLDSYHTQPALAPVLLHEAVHALQFSRLEQDVSKLQIADYIKLHRAAEADASANQAAFSYEIKDRYPAVYEQQMKTPMMQAYVSEIEKSADQNLAKQKAFKAWYSFDVYQKSYEKNHINEVQYMCSLAQKNPNEGYLKETCSNAQIIHMCSLNQKNYDMSFLASNEACAVSKDGKMLLQETLKTLSRELGYVPDKSVATLPIRQEQRSTEKSSAVSVALKKRSLVR